MNICMECNYEWEGNTLICPKCGCGNIDINKEEENE